MLDLTLQKLLTAIFLTVGLTFILWRIFYIILPQVEKHIKKYLNKEYNKSEIFFKKKYSHIYQNNTITHVDIDIHIPEVISEVFDRLDSEQKKINNNVLIVVLTLNLIRRDDNCKKSISKDFKIVNHILDKEYEKRRFKNEINSVLYDYDYLFSLDYTSYDYVESVDVLISGLISSEY